MQLNMKVKVKMISKKENRERERNLNDKFFLSKEKLFEIKQKATVLT